MSSPTDPSHAQTLDVRELDEEPFPKIMDALSHLEEDEALLLINNFEPEPLYDILDQRGFTYETSQIQSDEYHVVIEHT